MTDPRITGAIDQAVERGEIGLQVAAYYDNHLVLNVSVGSTGGPEPRPVDERTLFPVFSVTKAVTATALHLQAERGLIDYYAPVTDYWPEYGVNGKEATLVRHILMHRGGMPQIPAEVTTDQACDWAWMVEHLAAQPPLFEPGTTNCYHSLNWGWLVGEIVRRTDPHKRPFGEFVRQEICEPLGIRDLYIGLPPGESGRVATLREDSPAVALRTPIQKAAMPPGVVPSAEIYNRPDVQASCNPGAGGIMSAVAGARVFALLANRGELDGVRLLSEARLLDLTTPRDDADQIDQTGGTVRWIGVGGYWLGGQDGQANPLVGNGPHILQHGGAGGAIGWADLDNGLAVMITHNRMFSAEGMTPEDHPFIPIAEAIRSVVLS